VSTDSLRPELRCAVEAAQNKKAADVTLLDLGIDAFTDCFLLCTGFSTPHVQAISDEIEKQLGHRGVRPGHREGYDTAQWVLLDFGSFIVHIFSQRARNFYDLERLWRAAKRTDFRDPGPTAPAEAGPEGAGNSGNDTSAHGDARS
jgi:ribosome-associated protein